MSVPVNVFGRSSDLGSITYRLLGALANATVATDPTNSRVAGTLGDGAALTVTASLEHLRGAGGPAQRDGMARWLAGAGLAGPGLQQAIDMVEDLNLSLSFQLDDDADQEDVDQLVALAIQAAGWVDGFVLAMASRVVLGPDGSVWAEPADDADGVESASDVVAPDPESVSPIAADDDAAIEDPFVAEARRALRSEGLVDGGIVVDGPALTEAPPAQPPTIEAIRRRAILSAAVAARALNEFDGEHLAAARQGLLDWVEETGAAVDAEPDEARLLDAAPGAIDTDALRLAAWNTESAAVLGWALGTIDLAPPDQVSDPGAVFASLGLAEPELTAAAFDVATPRTSEEIAAAGRRLRTVHRRLDAYASDASPVDVVAAAGDDPTVALDGLEIVDGDLALDGVPVAAADPTVIAVARNIAAQRYRAIAWIERGGSFAETDIGR